MEKTERHHILDQAGLGNLSKEARFSDHLRFNAGRSYASHW